MPTAVKKEGEEKARGRRAEAQSAVQIKDIFKISLNVLVLWCGRETPA